jgi:N-acetylmuramoyl-L-alanine amidase
MIPCIDPGHGGPTNRGAYSKWLGYEADYVLDFCLKLYDVFRSAGIEARLTRSLDKDTSWDMRRSIARGCDLVLSIHVNSAQSARLQGLQTYHWPRNRVGRNLARGIADRAPYALRRRIGRHVAVNDRTTYLRRAYNLIKAYRETTVLIELGYGSNYSDAQALLNDLIKADIIGTILSEVSRLGK